jgi:hypothetical protein
MPRNFDSADRGRVVFVENVDCPSCGLTFEGVFVTEDAEVEDVVEAPEAQQACPGCNTVFESELTGWHMHQESG